MKNNQPYVYLVDDSPLNLKALKSKLRSRLGLKVRTFESAEECLRIMEIRPPDLVISDYFLDPLFSKKMNGDDLLSRIKISYPDLPVIMYSSSNNVNLIVDLIKMGAVDFISRNQKFETHLMEVVKNNIDNLNVSHDKKLIKKGIILSLIFLVAGSLSIYLISPGSLNYLLAGLCMLVIVFFTMGFFKIIAAKTSRWFRYIGGLFTFTLKREYSIFIVDDSEVYRIMILKALDSERSYINPVKFNIKVFSSGEECLRSMNQKPNILILDYLLEGVNNSGARMNGLELLKKVKEISPYTEVVMISCQKDLDVIAKLIREGANDYIVKNELWRQKIRQTAHDLIVKNVNRSLKAKGVLMAFIGAITLLFIIMMYYLFYNNS
ncbi:MAG: response regulator [Bacteroidota bacterium]